MYSKVCMFSFFILDKQNDDTAFQYLSSLVSNLKYIHIIYDDIIKILPTTRPHYIGSDKSFL